MMLLRAVRSCRFSTFNYKKTGESYIVIFAEDEIFLIKVPRPLLH